MKVEKLATLNFTSEQCFEKIISAFDSKREESQLYFFIQGLASTGKTFLYNVLCHQSWTKENIVFCITFFGIASLLLLGKCIFHYCPRIFLNFHKSLKFNIAKNLKLGDFLCQVTLLIWDKVPMQHRSCFEAVDQIFQDIRINICLFRG